MRFSKVIYLAAAIALIPAAAQAKPKWRTIHTSSDLKVALDTSSIVASPDGSYAVWTQWDYSKARILENKTSYTRLVEKVQLKCSPIVMKRVNTALYDKAGKVVKDPEELPASVVSAMTWDAPRKGSEGAHVWAAVCKSLKAPKKK